MRKRFPRLDGTPITAEWIRSQTVTDSNGCWIWQRAFNNYGYSIISIKGSSKKGHCTLVHRLLWSLVNGPIPEGGWILHKCDNPPCINLDHLYLGTPKQNTHDTVTRGRHRYIAHPGSKNGSHKLTESDVLFIRKSTLKVAELAAMFNVHFGTIYSILCRDNWKHI
jgi:hypothetical protein